MALRSFNDVVDSLLTFVRAANNRINLVVGSAVRDFLQSVGQEFAKTYVLQEWSRRQGSTALLRKTLTDTTFKDQLRRSLPRGTTAADVEQLITDACDQLASNVGVVRAIAEKAKVPLRLQNATAKTGVTIPAGSVSAQTSSVPPVLFVNTETVTGASTTFDPITNLNFLDVAAEATIAGASGNVAGGTVRTLSPAQADFSSVTNPTPSEGGADVQSNASLLDTIDASLLGLNINTIGGYPKFLLNTFPIMEDARVVDPLSKLLKRLPVGAADIYTIGESSKQFTDSYVFLGVDIVLRKQPVLEVDSVFALSSQGVQQFTPGVDFVFVKDDGLAAGSVLGQDRISFLSGATPIPGTSITVIYRQNKLIEDAQVALTDDPSNTVVGADILVKAGLKVLINMIMRLRVLPDFNLTEVQAAVSQNIAAFLASRKLGQGAFYSDIIGVVENTDGVDRVDVPFTLLARDGQSGNSDVPVAENEFVRAGSVQFI